MIDITIISPLNPSSKDSGSKIRIFHLIKELHGAGHQINLIIINSHELALSDELKAITHSIVLADRPERSPGVLARLRSPVPSYPKYTHLIKRDLTNHAVDLVIACKTFALAQLDFNWLNARGIPVFADEACVYQVAYLRELEQETNHIRKLMRWIRYRRLQRFESQLLAKTNLSTAVSPDEQDLLRKMQPAVQTLLIPNGISPDDCHTCTPFAKRDPELFFCGDYRYQPNADAIHYYAADIVPLLKEIAPRCQLNMAGKNPPESIFSHADAAQWINPLGYVENIHECFQRYQIMINPMRQGTGTRLKMLESLAAGMACVSTTVGAEGLGLADREHLRLADTPLAFAQAISELIQNPAAAEEMGRRARSYMLKNFTWKKAFEPLSRACIIAASTAQNIPHPPVKILPPVSILICTKSNHSELKKAVVSIQNCSYPAKLLHIVVLEETDEPQPIDGTDYHTLPLLHKGFGYARNQSLKLARHEITVFIDDDCIAEPDWLENLIRPLLNDSELLATAGMVRVPECGPIGECESILGFPGGGIKLFHKSGGKPMPSATFSTCNCAVRLSAIKEAGGFNESRCFGGEDEELSRYITQNGEILFVPEACLKHAPRDSFRAIWPWFFRRGRAAGESNGFQFLLINVWLRLLAVVITCLLLHWPLLPVLLLLAAFYYLNILWRFRWARAYYTRKQTLLILPAIRWTMDAAMGAGVLFERIRCFRRKST